MTWSRLCWCMSPQKLLFCYQLPTQGRAGVKLRDAWYVANVSIIFDAPCLFYTNCFMFFYTSWHFYAISRTNLLTRCHSASSCFLLFLCFKKVTQEIFSELDETKPKVPIFSDTRRSPKQRRRRAPRWPHHLVAPPPLAVPGYGVDPWSTPWHRSSAYIFSPRQKS
jgi:hypothetical protein